MLEKLKLSVEKVLKRYDILPKGESGTIDYYIISDIEKPIIIWISKIIFTSIPIILLFLSFLQLNWIIIPYSIGTSIAWWIVVEFVKDLKRTK